MQNFIFKSKTGLGLNLIKSEFERGFMLLSILFTLGIGQMWGAVGYESSDCGIKYSHNGGSDTEWNFSGQSAQTKTLDGNTTALYLKQWFAKMYQNEDNTIYGQSSHKCVYKIHRTAVAAGTTGFTTLDANWWDWTSWDGGGYRHPKGGNNSLDINLLSGLGSGKYTLTFYFQHNGNQTYKSTTNTLKWTYNIVPSVSSFAVTPDNVVSGTGTDGDPYIITYGEDMTLTVSGSKASTDANSSLYAKFGSNSYSSTLTKTYTVSTTKQSVTVKAKYYNSDDDLSGSESSTTIYYKTVSTPSIYLSAPSSGVRGESVDLTASISNASTPTIYYEYSTSSTFASSITEINHTTSTTQAWTIPAGTDGTTYYLRAKMQVSSTWYYSSILTFTAYGKKTIKVRNTNNWGTMKLYLYSDSGEKEAWHGSTSGISSYSGQWKTVVLTSEWPYFILNDNGSNQIKGDKTYKYSNMTDGNCYAIGSGSGSSLTLSPTDCPTAPTSVTTNATPVSITNTGMTVRGSIGTNGNDNITDYGFYYGTTDACGTKAQVGTSNTTGDISKALTGLTAGTTYYFKTYATNAFGTTYGTVRSYKVPYSVTVNKSTGCSSISPTAGAYYYNAGFTVTAVAATGYTFSSWSKTNGTTTGASSPSAGTNTVTFTPTANSATITATYTANTYTVTLDKQTSAPGYSSAGNATCPNARYDAAAPSLSGTVPTAAQGYAFVGFYTEPLGAGVKLINADKSWVASVANYTDGSRNWIHDGDVTLYAYYKKAKITAITLSPNPVNPSTTVSATTTLDPTSVTGPTIICWRLLYSNGNPVSPQPTFSPASGSSVSFSSPATGGTFKVEAIIRKSNSCGSGEVLDSVTNNLVVAASHTVTIKYMCGDEIIKTQTTTTADPINYTSVTAPDIFGYSFTTWVLGDGMTKHSSDALTKQSGFRFQANYDGVLIARYRKRGIIYFQKPTDWTGDKVYYYNLGSADKWHTGEVDWNKRGIYTKDISWGAHEMTRITGTSIYYYDYEAANNAAANPGDYIAFADKAQDGYEPMYACCASYPIQYTKGFNAGTPMFVCSNHRQSNLWNEVAYYNKGYWTKYEHGSGYTLKIYNQKGGGRQELKSVRFVTDGTNNYEIPFKATVDLDANTTFGFKIVRDDNLYFKNDNDGTMTNESHDGWPFVYDGSDGSACGITTTAAGSYTFTLSYFNTGNNDDHQLRVTVDYPAAVKDFRILYYDTSDKTCWSKTHAVGWRHPSRLITARANGVDTVSFFVAKGYSPTLYAHKVNSIDAGSGVITWGSLNIGASSSMALNDLVSESGVYTFIVRQSSTAGTISSVTLFGAYTGEYYIRCGALNSKWDNYTHDIDHLMTYTAYSESDENPGTKYSHYKAKWCPRGKRVNFCIANDYSPCITDTLWQDDPNTYNNIYPENDGIRPGELKASHYDGSGNIDTDETTDKYSANIRFMWNRKTNKIGRAYVASATTAERQFLVLQGCDEMYNVDGSEFGNPGEDGGTYRAIFHDDQDFIYERIITIQPTTRAKVYACYAADPADVPNAQYFRGAWDGGACGSASNSVQIIGGSPGDYTFYKVRVIYDFKTNRLICAWMPTEKVDVDRDVPIDADVMVIRDHQEGAEAITFKEEGDKLSKVKYVYCVMRFNRWTLNNRARGKGGADDQDEYHCNTPEAISEYHPILPVPEQTSIYERALYFVSFPFDVELSEVFGLGTYGKHWIISRYNGLRRAQEGYFRDNCFNSDCTNWDYIWDRKGVRLNAYEGYLLSLEIDSMLYDNTRFWPNNISQKELYFPSAKTMNTITETNITVNGLTTDYQCTKNFNTVDPGMPGYEQIKDRRIYDSYWRCIGTPSYAPYGAAVKNETSGGSEITWKADYSWRGDFSEFPFLYAWNVDDNSLSPQATNRFNFKPMHAYLVQNRNAMYWTAVSATPQSIVRRQRRAIDENGDYYWRIILSRGDKEDDQAYIRMTDDEQVTDAFDFSQDLSKEFSYGHSAIYSYVGETQTAANSMPMHTDSTTIIPLGLNIWAAGPHTISMPDGGDGVGVELVDLQTGERVNLSAGFVYNFEAEKGYIEDRFQLEISPVKGTHTGIENVNVESADESKARKVLIDGALYIVRDGKMYDARGARIK